MQELNDKRALKRAIDSLVSVNDNSSSKLKHALRFIDLKKRSVIERDKKSLSKISEVSSESD